MIDYAAARREGPALKGALTRAERSPDAVTRARKVAAACERALAAWERWGAWPDDWSRWQRAAYDAHFNLRQAADYPPTPAEQAAGGDLRRAIEALASSSTGWGRRST